MPFLEENDAENVELSMKLPFSVILYRAPPEAE